MSAEEAGTAVATPDRQQDYSELSDMGKWAHDAHQVSIMAARLVQTEFVPAAYRDKPAEATAAILYGLEVGLQPMAALQSIVPIQGTPTMYAKAIRGLVQSKGHTIRKVEADDTHAVFIGWRRGETEADAQQVVWTIERAEKLGLTNKPNWKNQPQAMLVARATSEIARLIASDALMGIGYSIEEMQDVEEGGSQERPVQVPGRQVEARTERTTEPDGGAPVVADPEPPKPAETSSGSVLTRDEGAVVAEAAAAFPDEEPI